jgi:hypothetical protein
MERFALPLLAGGRVACSAPLGWRVSRHWRTMLRPQLLATLHHALRMRAAGVDATPPSDPDEATLVLLAAVHDLFATTHPDTSNLLDTSARLLKRHAMAARALPPPDSLAQALARHAVVDAALRSHREDVRVTWWTGSAEFAGQTPPARLVAFPRVRRVNQETRQVPLVKHGLSHGSVRLKNARRVLVESLFLASPLSALLHSMDDDSPVALDLRQSQEGRLALGPMRFLGHQPLRTVLADHALAAGFFGPITSWSQAVNALVTTPGPPAWAVMRAVRFTLNLHERRLWDVANAPRVAGSKPPALLTDEQAQGPAARLVWGLWDASVRVAALAEWPTTPDLEPLVEQQKTRVASAAVQEASASFQRAILTRLDERTL